MAAAGRRALGVINHIECKLSRVGFTRTLYESYVDLIATHVSSIWVQIFFQMLFKMESSVCFLKCTELHQIKLLAALLGDLLFVICEIVFSCVKRELGQKRARDFNFLELP